ncbi:MAG: hypothetical protein WCO42_11195 [bacterium]
MSVVRTIKLKRNPQASGGGPAGLNDLSAPETTGNDGSAPDQGSAPAPALHSSAAAIPTAVATVSRKSSVWFMLIAACAVIGLLTIMGLQYSEWSFYKADPSVWLLGK